LKINFQTVFCGFCRKNRGGNLAKAKPATNNLERKLLHGKSYGHNYEKNNLACLDNHYDIDNYIVHRQGRFRK